VGPIKVQPHLQASQTRQEGAKARKRKPPCRDITTTISILKRIRPQNRPLLPRTKYREPLDETDTHSPQISAGAKMGIKQLFTIIKENAPDAIKEGEIKNQFGRKVAIVRVSTDKYIPNWLANSCPGCVRLPFRG
jgi:hypothetical protein